MAIGKRVQEARERLAAVAAQAGDLAVTTTDTQTPNSAPEAKYTPDQLRAIVQAGMSITEATMLLADGYAPDFVLELAEHQAAQRIAQAADTQTATAKAMQKAMRPENEFHPGISSMSYPEGDRVRPKAPLPYEFFYNGYPCHKFPETEHWREWELMAEVKPGVYTVMRKDGSVMRVEVTAERDANDQIRKVFVSFPVTREDKFQIPPKSVVLFQIAKNDNPRLRFVEAMNEWLALSFAAA